MSHARDRTSVSASLNELFARLNAPCEIKATSYGGLGVFASRRILAGEPILHESPLLLTVSASAERTNCARCLAPCEPGDEWDIRCMDCERVFYCSELCKTAHVHDAIECNARAAAANDANFDDELSDLVTQAIAALALRHRNGTVSLLPSLKGSYDSYESRLCGIRRTQRNGRPIKEAVLASLRAVAPSARVPPKELFTLLDRHQANVYGVIGPGNADVALASFVGAFHLFNHSCLPNLVFDCQPRCISGRCCSTERKLQ